MDNELFELCKEVYKRTGWQTDAMQFEHSVIGEVDPNHRGESDKTFAGYRYTSDYLLEKLESKSPTLTHFHDEPEDRRWGAVVWESIESGYADTPLKALLELTLALDEAGIKL